MLLPQKTITTFGQPPQQLVNKDKELLDELAHHSAATYISKDTNLPFFNAKLAAYAQNDYSVTELEELEDFLRQKGTLNIPILNGITVPVDGVDRPVSIVAATETTASHGDMSSMLYLRDHVQTARTYMELYLHNSVHYQKEGEVAHTLIASALHLMSTTSQLARFKDVILRGTAAGQEDWPHISLRFDDLAGNKPNNWRNKQDSFQMLAYLVFDAIEQGFIAADDLLPAHQTFLGSIVPLLRSVGFPLYESSGSWEEIEACRTSVMAVETALLHKIDRFITANPESDFLQNTFAQYSDDDFQQVLTTLYGNGLRELGRRLPGESPDYPASSVKYRTSDAALCYVLMYDLPCLLADESIEIGSKNPQKLTATEIEDLILSQLNNLIDKTTGGIIRYAGDSYQRTNFHTNQGQWVIATIKRRVTETAQQTKSEVDLDEKQYLRNTLTPTGREAAWTHPLGQVSAWAAQRYNKTGSEEYRKLSISYFNSLIALVTGEEQWNAAISPRGYYSVQKVASYRLPECYIAYVLADDSEFIVPSPHTPLNWSSAMLKLSIGLLQP